MRWFSTALVALIWCSVAVPVAAEPESTPSETMRQHQLERGSSPADRARLKQLVNRRSGVTRAEALQHGVSKHGNPAKPKPSTIKKAKAPRRSPKKTSAPQGPPPRGGVRDTTADNNQGAQKPAPTKARPLPKPVPLTPVEQALSQALQLRVDERGPRKPWTITLTNVGQQPVRVFEDARLLWFSAMVPAAKGKTKDVECHLPSSMVPTFAPDRHRVTLLPGQTLRFDVDPRFYCFNSKAPATLLPKSRLQAHYGWPEKTRPVWRRGKKEKVRLAQVAPFAFKPSPERDEGLREVVAPVVELDERYAAWQPAPGKTRGDTDPDDAFRLVMSQGADATSGRGVSVQLTLENLTQVTQRVYFKPDHMTFVIRGPDGTVRCKPDEVYGAPDAQNLTTLGPGQHKSVTVRLSEFCADAIFERAGFYYVSANVPRPLTQAELSADGEQPAEDERRTVRSVQPCLVRIQRGEEPFSHWAPRRLMVRSSGAASAPSDSPERAGPSD